jgi:hypothetical protein
LLQPTAQVVRATSGSQTLMEMGTASVRLNAFAGRLQGSRGLLAIAAMWAELLAPSPLRSTLGKMGSSAHRRQRARVSTISITTAAVRSPIRSGLAWESRRQETAARTAMARVGCWISAVGSRARSSSARYSWAFALLFRPLRPRELKSEAAIENLCLRYITALWPLS